MGIKGTEIGKELDIEGLCWIYKFGWLRSSEIGRLLWPGSEHSEKYGQRICRKWNSRPRWYVIKRRLPYGAGSAYLLSESGVRFLEEHGISARGGKGKDWGETTPKLKKENKFKKNNTHYEKKEDKTVYWIPPSTWMHDLRSASLLALLYELGHEIMTELEIKRIAPGLAKIPDGLIKIKGSQTVCWLEVERAIKTGKFLDELIKAIINVANKKSPIIGPWRSATEVILAFSEEDKDSRGFNLSHQNRIINAIKSTSRVDISITLMKLKMTGFKVDNISVEKETIKADKVELMLKRMKWRQESSGEIWCRIPPYLSTIKRNDEKLWIAEVFDTTDNRPEWQRIDSIEPRLISNSTSHTITESKRACASAVSRLIDL